MIDNLKSKSIKKEVTVYVRFKTYKGYRYINTDGLPSDAYQKIESIRLQKMKGKLRERNKNCPPAITCEDSNGVIERRIAACSRDNEVNDLIGLGVYDIRFLAKITGNKVKEIKSIITDYEI